MVLGNEQRPNGDTEPVNDNPENRLAIWDLKEPKDQYPRRADLKPVSADLGKDDSAKRQTSYTNASAFVMRNQNIRSEVAERVVHMGHRRPPDYNHPACEQLLETRLQDHGAEEKDPTDTDWNTQLSQQGTLEFKKVSQPEKRRNIWKLSPPKP